MKNKIFLMLKRVSSAGALLLVPLSILLVAPSAKGCFPICNANNASSSQGKNGCASENWYLNAQTTSGSDSGPGISINEGAGCSYTWTFCDGTLQIAADYYAKSPTFIKGQSTSRSIQVWWNTWGTRRADTDCDQPQAGRWKTSNYESFATEASVGTTLLICDSPGGRLGRKDKEEVAYCEANTAKKRAQ